MHFQALTLSSPPFIVAVLLLLLFLLTPLALTYPIPIYTPIYTHPLTPRNQTPLNNLINTILTNIPPINGALNDVLTPLTDSESLIASITKQQTTYNDFNHDPGSGSCTPYTLLFARGTTEPGNVGIFVGPSLIEALKERKEVGDGLGSGLRVQGVNDYSATVEGYSAGGDEKGSLEMASEIKNIHSSCPKTHLIVSGYSQGCQIVHNAIKQVPSDTAEWISSVLVFGDPDENNPIPNVPSSKVFTACHDADSICQDSDIVAPAHLTYAMDVKDAASFAVARAAAS